MVLPPAVTGVIEGTVGIIGDAVDEIGKGIGGVVDEINKIWPKRPEDWLR